jgi:PAS domain S-box-containing protein
MSAEVVERPVPEQALREADLKYRFLFDHMMNGFAYHKVLFDDHGKPVDYMYLEVNDAFEKMTGLKKEDVVGKRVTELIPGVEHEQAGWIEKYGSVALTGKPIRFENYSEGLRRWYSVSAYSLGTPYFATVFEDITARKQAEAEASAQQMHLAEALEAADMVTWEWDIPNRSIRYSDNIGAIARGVAVEPYSTLDGLMQQIHPEDREGLAQAIDQTSKQGTPFECEYRVHMLDGSYRWILGKGKRVIVEGGKPVRVLGVSMDITEQRRAEEALRETEASRKVAEAVEAERKLFYEVLETLPAYVVLLTPDYHAAFANRTFRERFGESQGLRCFEFLFGRSEPCETCETYNALKTMEPHAWEWRGPDGCDYSVFDYPFTDVDGSTLILEMGIDITERKRAEEALRDASRYTRNLIEASLDPLVTISAEGKIMDVNRATEQSTGFSRDQLIGTDFLNYFTEPEKAREGYQEVFREGLVKDYPLAIRHKSGKVTDVLYNAAVYKNEAGDVQGVFAAARDVTELKGAEAELRTKEAQIRFFASQCLTAQETERRRIAAELHDSTAASLAAIKFRIEKTREDVKKGLDVTESLQDLSSNVAQSLAEVRRIMTDLRPSVLDDLGILPALNWFCREYQKTYAHISVEKQMGIEEQEVPDSLRTPIFRIAQEAMNNVAKHSLASLVKLAIQKEGEKILLSIQDNGVGFDPGTASKGMGLSSIRERAQLSGGAFELQSGMGKGTTIRVSWPR